VRKSTRPIVTTRPTRSRGHRHRVTRDQHRRRGVVGAVPVAEDRPHVERQPAGRHALGEQRPATTSSSSWIAARYSTRQQVEEHVDPASAGAAGGITLIRGAVVAAAATRGCAASTSCSFSPGTQPAEPVRLDRPTGELAETVRRRRRCGSARPCRARTSRRGSAISAGLEHQPDGLGDRHEEPGDVGMGDRDRQPVGELPTAACRAATRGCRARCRSAPRRRACRGDAVPCTTYSASSFEAPSTDDGSAALSVEISTNRSAPAASAASTTFWVP
jgi:hypothetical protein